MTSPSQISPDQFKELKNFPTQVKNENPESVRKVSDVVDLNSHQNIYFESENFSSSGNNLQEEAISSKTAQPHKVNRKQSDFC